MRKWHPASGDWGFIGRTAGRKEAEKSKKQISGMMSDVQGRKGGINQYFNELQNINVYNANAKNNIYSVNSNFLFLLLIIYKLSYY